MMREFETLKKKFKNMSDTFDDRLEKKLDEVLDKKLEE
jgi:hypothetical protein